MSSSKTRKNGLSYVYNSPNALKKALAIQRIMSRKSIPEATRIRMAAAIERYGANTNVNAVLAGENADAAEMKRMIRNAPNSKTSKNRMNIKASNKANSRKAASPKPNGNTKRVKKWAPVATRSRVGI